MKYFIFLSLLFLFIFPLKAQKSKFQIGIIGSADVAYRTLFLEKGRDDIAFIVDSRNSRETPKLGYSGGLSFSYSLNSHFMFISGVQYSNMGYKTKNSVFTSDQVDPRRGFIYQPRSEHYDLRYVYNYDYVEMPLSLQYQLGKRKWKPSLSLGISPGYLAGGKSTVVRDFNNGDVERSRYQMDLSTANRFSVTPFANLRVNYQMNNLLSIQVAAHFRYNVVNLYDTTITESHWNGGLQIGCF